MSPSAKKYILAEGTNAWEYQWDTTLMKNGNYLIKIRAYDGGNYSENHYLMLNVQNAKANAPPNVIISSPKNDLLFLKYCRPKII